MDKYPLMCSKLTQLQEEWEPKVGDKVNSTHYGDKGIILRVYNDSCLTILLEDGLEYFDDIKNLIYKPSFEDLIEMLGKISWRLKKVEVDVNRYSYEAWTWKMPKDGLWAGSPQKALLKLVAFEKWGLTWDDEKETWEEGHL